MAETPARTRVRVLEMNQQALSDKVTAIQASLVGTQDYVATVPQAMSDLAYATEELGAAITAGDQALAQSLQGQGTNILALSQAQTALEARVKSVEDKQKTQDASIVALNASLGKLNLKVFGIPLLG